MARAYTVHSVHKGSEPDSTCPKCDMKGTKPRSAADHNKRPEKGDIQVCYGCGFLQVFDVTPMSYPAAGPRPMTAKELVVMITTPDLMLDVTGALSAAAVIKSMPSGRRENG